VAGQAGAVGHADGQGTAATFNNPTCLTLDGKGQLLVTDTNNATIRKVDPATGAVTTVLGVPGVASSDLDAALLSFGK